MILLRILMVLFEVSVALGDSAVEKFTPLLISKTSRCSATHLSLPSEVKLWKCPEVAVAVTTKEICDGFLHCSRTFADEKNCVRLTNETDNGNLSLVRMYVPSRLCSATICYHEDSSVNAVNAHLVCRYLGYMTFIDFGYMSNVNSEALSLGYDSLQCKGHETSIQQCITEEPSFKLLQCNKLLTTGCRPDCQFDLQQSNGTIVSPGFPNVSFSMLDCVWTIIGPKDTVIELLFTSINLQEMDDEAQDDDLCSNSYIEIGLGVNETNKASDRYKRLRLCREVHAKKYISLSNRIYIRYNSGLYFGPLAVANGFEMHFNSIEIKSYKINDENELDGSSELSGGFIALIAICVIFGSFLFIIAFVWWFKRRRNEIRLIRRHEEEMFKERCKANDYCSILLRAYEVQQFSRPLTCPKCEKICYKSTELCTHFKRMYNVLVLEENDRIAKELLLDRLNANHRNKNATCTSNVTVDLDDLLGSRCLEQSMTVDTLLKVPERSPINSGITNENEETEKKSYLMTNFLEPLANIAKKLSSSSWRTPSPNKTSTPTTDDKSMLEKRRKILQNRQSKVSLSPDSPQVATVRQAARKLKWPSDFNPHKKMLKVCSTSAARQKPPKIVVFPSSVKRQPPSPPSFVPRNCNKKPPRSISLQLLSVNQNYSTNSLTPLLKRCPSKPESAPGQLEEYSNFQSLSSFGGSPPESNNSLNENINVEIHNSNSAETTPTVFVHL